MAGISENARVNRYPHRAGIPALKEKGWAVLEEHPFKPSWSDQLLDDLLKNTKRDAYVQGTGGSREPFYNYFERVSDNQDLEKEIIKTIRLEYTDEITEYGKKIEDLINSKASDGQKVKFRTFEVRWNAPNSTERTVSPKGHTDSGLAMTWSNNQGTVIHSGKNRFETPSNQVVILEGRESGYPITHSSPIPNDQPRLFIQWFFIKVE
jgi:hypothetical protein